MVKMQMKRAELCSQMSPKWSLAAGWRKPEDVSAIFSKKKKKRISQESPSTLQRTQEGLSMLNGLNLEYSALWNKEEVKKVSYVEGDITGILSVI